VPRLRDSGMRNMVLAGLLALAAGGGLALLVSSADGQASSQPLFHSSGTLIFNFVPRGSTSEAELATISNAGEGVLEITSVEVPPSSESNFSVVADGCTGTSLGAGQSCVISVVFHPTVVGTLVGDLVIEDARGECDNYVSLVGSGTETSGSTPSIARAADCIVPGQPVTAPGRTVTIRAPTVTVTAPPKILPSTEPNLGILNLTSTARCTFKHQIEIDLYAPRGSRIISAHVYIDGHLSSSARSNSVRVIFINLRDKAPKRYRVRIVAHTSAGATLNSPTHYFVTCTASELKDL
jgi:hypothetical protein